MAAMIQNDEEKAWMLPMLEFRNEIAGNWDIDRKRRDFRRMDGRLTWHNERLVHGPYTQETRKYFLTRLLEVEKLVHEIGPEEIKDAPLITMDELRFIRQIWLNSVYTRSGQNSTPNSNATNLHSSQKRCCSFCISSSNASPTFQVQKSIFHQMTKPIQVTVILPLLLAISFSRNDDIHSSISGISNDLIGVIPTIGQ